MIAEGRSAIAATESQRLRESLAHWDQEAAAFDNEPDHGLRDARVHAAWAALLCAEMPLTPSRILDIGCGTGSISVLLSRLGHDVTGADLSPAMVARARGKANRATQAIVFLVLDASVPAFAPGQFNVIVCRHLLWALPEPALVLQRWADLLASPGRLLLIEGYWHTGGGMISTQVVAALPVCAQNVRVENLSTQHDLWGAAVSDQRYLICADFA